MSVRTDNPVLNELLEQAIDDIRMLCNTYDFFFFPSRRRHTIFDCDWSSDVCSSVLVVRGFFLPHARLLARGLDDGPAVDHQHLAGDVGRRVRSEIDRCVGDVLRCAPAAQRYRSRDALLHRRVEGLTVRNRKSTRLNSSHSQISYAVFCLKKKTN